MIRLRVRRRCSAIPVGAARSFLRYVFDEGNGANALDRSRPSCKLTSIGMPMRHSPRWMRGPVSIECDRGRLGSRSLLRHHREADIADAPLIDATACIDAASDCRSGDCLGGNRG